MKQLLFLYCLIFTTIANSQNNNPIVPKEARLVSDFVPNNWKIIKKIEGDLNKDKINDIVLIIENTAIENYIINDGLGKDTLNVNPRFLLILFHQNSTYILKSINKKFIPSQDDAESPCLADPLQENGEISISNGILNINFKYWLSCGSWFVTTRNFKFRFQNDSFVLIGFDSSSFHRSTGEINSESINFLTKKKKISIGGNEFVEKIPKTNWKKITIEKLIPLENLTTISEINY